MIGFILVGHGVSIRRMRDVRRKGIVFVLGGYGNIKAA